MAPTAAERELREWETFTSIFKSLIHENETLTNVDKVHYLVGQLKGPALTVCSGLAPRETIMI
ncbi:hypothetical protein NQ317_018029 [Molorchus minor]|uniref:Uncharacterized protein n=1 Tax=Molorchus minor TaxID=1323400 RepID=A0ABQ9JTB5_9CUCU|nr:hypothetical protein NQ317_018029 [Molorchus minor]